MKGFYKPIENLPDSPLKHVINCSSASKGSFNISSTYSYGFKGIT